MSALFPTYNRFDISVASAEGTTITDDAGKEYLDFGSGISVCNLGHRHAAVQQAVEKQLKKYWHVSNLYHIPLQEKVAKQLTDHSAGTYVFFCNSGAEANEAAIKLARKATGKTKIISFEQSFHGRTFATMSATGQDKIKDGFGPMLQSFEYVPYNDLAALQEAVDDETAAVMLEVIQGEGGVVVGDTAFIKAVEKVCDEQGVLLIVDEIQTGLGRTGKPFAHQHYGISPDIITVAKALGNGLPVGAMIGKKELRDVFGPGSHGTTFGGNPLAMAAAQAVLTVIFQEAFLQDVEKKAIYLQEQLQATLGNLPIVQGIRGKGLMIGIVCRDDISSLIPEMIQKGLIVLQAGPNVIRLLPALTITEKDIDQAVHTLGETLQQMNE